MLRRFVALWLLTLGLRAAAVECDDPSTSADDRQLRAAHPRPDDLLQQLRARAAADPNNLDWRLRADLVRDDELYDYAGALADERALWAAHPDDPHAALLVANLLRFSQPQEALAILQTALAKSPTFARAHRLMSDIYDTLHETAHAEHERAAFYQACPASYLAFETVADSTDAALRARAATALRAQLAKETTPAGLAHYATLWSLELKGASSKQMTGVRKRIADDLARLRTLAPAPDAELLHTFDIGYQTTGDAAGKKWVAALRAQAPPDEHGLMVAYMAWQSTHPYPAASPTPDAVKAYLQAQAAAGREWVKTWPRSSMAWDAAVADIGKTTPVADVRAVAARMLQSCDDCRTTAASLYINHAIELDQALALLEADRANTVKQLHNVRLQSARPQPFAVSVAGDADGEARIYELKHDRAGLRRTLAWFKKQLDENPQPNDQLHHYYAAHEQFTYVALQARLADEEKRYADAAAWWLDLSRRDATFGLSDDDTDTPAKRARASWTRAGGTDEGWALLDATASPAPVASSQSGWRAESKPLPPMSLRDLHDHVWTLKQLAGKPVLMVAWATWCEPCKAELPHVQKLYEAARRRGDLRVLTLNMDAEPGPVAPFIAEHHYTFPVVDGSAYLSDLLTDMPFSMVVDQSGVIRGTRAGFGETTNWEEETERSIRQLLSSK